jgi:hypothetical protein
MYTIRCAFIWAFQWYAACSSWSWNGWLTCNQSPVDPVNIDYLLFHGTLHVRPCNSKERLILALLKIGAGSRIDNNSSHIGSHKSRINDLNNGTFTQPSKWAAMTKIYKNQSHHGVNCHIMGSCISDVTLFLSLMILLIFLFAIKITILVCLLTKIWC